MQDELRFFLAEQPMDAADERWVKFMMTPPTAYTDWGKGVKSFKERRADAWHNAKIYKALLKEFANPKRHRTPELAKIAAKIAKVYMDDFTAREKFAKQIESKIAATLTPDGLNYKMNKK
jgi:hypothetical protein